ncbi:MAG: LysR family transcriptional regulator [Clostridia bacterium]|nr:LysR family transcriptional regulator [Clostridia bacterium]
MNRKQLQYVIELSEELNFSAVAEKIGITQPALSKQVLSLEKELDVKLFDRNNIPMTLTPAGEHFIAEAKKLIYKEDQLLRSMEDYKSGKLGKLEIGISPFRSLYLIPYIVNKVKEKFPGVTVVLHEEGSDLLRKNASEGKYDFAVVNLPVDESVLDVKLIEADTLVLAVPEKFSENFPASSHNSIPEIELKDCKKLPFVVVSPQQEMRQLFDKMCAEVDFTPDVATEVVGVSTAWSMARAGVGATLLPLQFVENFDFDKSIALFKLKNCQQSRQPAIVTRRGQYLSEYAKYAIELLTQKNI